MMAAAAKIAEVRARERVSEGCRSGLLSGGMLMMLLTGKQLIANRELQGERFVW